MNNLSVAEFIEIFKTSLDDYLKDCQIKKSNENFFNDYKEFNDKFEVYENKNISLKNYLGNELDTYHAHFYAFDKWCAEMDEHGDYLNNLIKKLRTNG